MPLLSSTPSPQHPPETLPGKKKKRKKENQSSECNDLIIITVRIIRIKIRKKCWQKYLNKNNNLNKYIQV